MNFLEMISPSVSYSSNSTMGSCYHPNDNINTKLALSLGVIKDKGDMVNDLLVLIRAGYSLDVPLEESKANKFGRDYKLLYSLKLLETSLEDMHSLYNKEGYPKGYQIVYDYFMNFKKNSVAYRKFCFLYDAVGFFHNPAYYRIREGEVKFLYDTDHNNDYSKDLFSHGQKRSFKVYGIEEFRSLKLDHVPFSKPSSKDRVFRFFDVGKFRDRIKSEFLLIGHGLNDYSGSDIRSIIEIEKEGLLYRSKIEMGLSLSALQSYNGKRTGYKLEAIYDKIYQADYQEDCQEGCHLFLVKELYNNGDFISNTPNMTTATATLKDGEA